MGKNHPENYNAEKMAIAIGKSLPVSMKHCVEISSFIRGKKLSKAKEMMGEVIALKKPVPFKKFNHNVGHRKGALSSGRFPQKACQEVLAILKSAESNAQFKGLNTNALVITHISACYASRPWRFGRQRRRKAKRTNVEIMVIEAESKPKDKEQKGRQSRAKEQKKDNSQKKETNQK